MKETFKPNKPENEWLRFKNGQPCPAMQWGNVIKRAVAEYAASQHPSVTDVGVVAFGKRQENIASLSFGKTVSAETIGHILLEVIHGNKYPQIEPEGAFDNAHKEIFESPGVSNLGIFVVASCETDEYRTATIWQPYSPDIPPEVTENLQSYADMLMTGSGVVRRYAMPSALVA